MSLFHRAAYSLPLEPQLRGLQEECAELTFSISKYLRGKQSEAPIIEECIDVLMFIIQMQYYFPSPLWNETFKLKKDRLQEILDRHANSQE